MNVSRVHRLLRLITLLQGGHSYTPDELAGELQISRRTVFRDLNMLELARIPYYFDKQKSGYKISQHFFLPPVNLTLPEALAMLVLTGHLGKRCQVPLLDHGAKAAMKIESTLPESIRRHVGSVVDRLSVHLPGAASHVGLEAIFDQLTRAMVHHYVCRLVYISFKDQKQISLEVHPLRLLFIARAWYLRAWSATHGEVLTFKLGRIKKLVVLSRTFNPPDHVQADSHFGQAWCMIPEGRLYDVNLRFLPKVAGNVAEVQWHASQKVRWLDDGSIDFSLTVDGLNEITWWILGYGDQVQVLAPRELRRKIARTARAVLEMHCEGN